MPCPALPCVWSSCALCIVSLVQLQQIRGVAVRCSPCSRCPQIFLQRTMSSSVTLASAALQPQLLYGLRQQNVVMLDMQTGAAAARAPFELCIMLDRSGSMAGHRLKAAKTAICSVIEALQEKDILHLVAYDDSPRVVFEAGDLEDRERLCQQVRGIRDGGSTDIGWALDSAAKVLNRSTSGLANRRIFLFSDGHPNQGLTTAEVSRIWVHGMLFRRRTLPLVQCPGILRACKFKHQGIPRISPK